MSIFKKGQGKGNKAQPQQTPPPAPESPAETKVAEPVQPRDFPNGNVSDIKPRNIFGHGMPDHGWWPK